MQSTNTFGAGKPTFQASAGVQYLDISDPAHTLYIQQQIPFGVQWVVKTKPSFPAIGIESVTGLNTDNTDPLNPVVKISVDGLTVTGQGTPGSPLVASGSGAVLVPVSAQAVLSRYDVVTADGYRANTATIGKRNRTLGFANENIAIGFVGEVVVEGEIKNPLWAWTVGLPIFLNGTSASQTCPLTGFTQILGVAIKTDTVEVSVHQSILL